MRGLSGRHDPILSREVVRVLAESPKWTPRQQGRRARAGEICSFRSISGPGEAGSGT
ncbi:MAG: hypothetical protein ACLUQ6_01930 [Alistipes onderdonkii]